MEHASDMTGLALAVLAALGGGMAMVRLGQPALVGYVIAGVLLGPGALGLVADPGWIAGLAELSVLLLLFAVGAALGVRLLARMWRTALPVAGLQILASVAVMFVVARILGLPPATALLLGFAMALAGPAIALAITAETGALRTRTGRLALAVLLAQALAFLPMLLVLRRAGAEGTGLASMAAALLAAALLAVFVGLLSRRPPVDLPFPRLVVGGADLSLLSALGYCFGAGALFGLIGLPPAYGAFLAGLLVGSSTRRRQITAALRPIGGVLALAFFLALGLLLDLRFVWTNLGTVLALLAAATLVRMALNVAALHLLREGWPRAFLGGVLVSQPGELGFLLAVSAVAAGAVGAAGATLAIALIVLSLCLGPLWMAAARRGRRLLRQPRLSRRDIPPAALAELILRGRLSAAGRAELRRRGTPDGVQAAPPRRPVVLALPGLVPGWRMPLGYAPPAPRRTRPPREPQAEPAPPPAAATAPRPATPPFAATPAGSLAEIGVQVRLAAGFDLDRRRDPDEPDEPGSEGGSSGDTPDGPTGGRSGA